tara:strand:+ start:10410 stop:11567 length:1158 start_codon:yes stop_codon:yes gene_type:complete
MTDSNGIKRYTDLPKIESIWACAFSVNIFNKLRNYKVLEFEPSFASTIQLGNIFTLIAVSISTIYSLVYYFLFDSLIASAVNQSFALGYLLYYFFLAKNQIKRAFIFSLCLLMTNLFVMTVFFLSSRSGLQFCFFCMGPLTHLFFNKLNISFQLLTYGSSAVLLIASELLGDRYLLTSIPPINLDFMMVLTVALVFVSFYKFLAIYNKEIALREHELEILTRVDPLTNISNRRAFYEVAGKLLSGFKRNKLPLSLLLFDVDNFKKINDVYGHHYGDVVLKTLANEVRHSIRTTDCFARFGGEEFIIIFPQINADELLLISEKIRHVLQNSEVKTDKGDLINYTVSIGATTFRETDDNLDMVIQRADEATYEAKKGGRNKVVLEAG